MSRKSLMSPKSKSVIEHLRIFGATSTDLLMAVLPGETLPALRKRLRNLEAGGWLKSEPNPAGVVMWVIHPSSRGLFSEHSSKARKTAFKAAPFVGTPALPRQINVMLGPVYQQPPSAGMRAGAFDFMRIASHGVRC